MKKLFAILTLAILACNLPVRLAPENAEATPTGTETAAPPTAAPTPQPIGSAKNPLILALPPAPRADLQKIEAGEKLAAFIQKRIGYRVVAAAPTSEANLLEALKNGNAHIAPLSPFGYLAARQANSVVAVLASARNGQAFYGAQFIVNRESEFIPFFDPARNENTAEAADALRQFQDKKPCWSDAASPSGYVIPLGALKYNGVQVKEGAFLEGQANVARAVYAGDICNFGATYIDARTLPALEANYPDMMERVKVVWRLPAIIPYENISVSTNLPFEMRRLIQRAFIDLTVSEEKTLLQETYGMDEIQAANDEMYAEFEKYWNAAGLPFSELIQ